MEKYEKNVFGLKGNLFFCCCFFQDAQEKKVWYFGFGLENFLKRNSVFHNLVLFLLNNQKDLRLSSTSSDHLVEQKNSGKRRLI